MSDNVQPNALGLDFSQPDQGQEEKSPASAVHASPTLDTAQTPKKKELPYINPDRVRTGGTQKGKLSEQELEERMARIREQNEKIKQRRLHVQEDEKAFRKHAEEDQARKEEYRKMQDQINATRATNAKLKMDLVGTREWDAVKAAEEDGWTEDNTGGRGGKRRRERRPPRRDYDVGGGGGGESIANDWANPPIEENVNSWGEAPIGGDISQWLPDTTTTQKNTDATDWAGLEDRNPVAFTTEASTGMPKYKGRGRDSKDNTASSKKKNDSFKPVPPESDPTSANVNDWGGEPVPERDWGQAPTGVDGEDDKNQEANDIPANWAADPVSTTGLAPVTEGATDWAGNPIASAADWGPTPTSQELERWLETSANAGIPAGYQDGHGRGRGRGRGEGRGRGRGTSERGGRGRGDGERGGRGRGEGGGRGRGEGRGRGRGRGDGEYRGGRGGRGRGDERS